MINDNPPAALQRRTFFGVVGGLGALAIAGCATDDSATGDTATSNPSTSSPSTTSPAPSNPSTTGGNAATSSTVAGDSASCAEIPEETAGPFPGDGSNGPDVLAEDGVVRQDIRTSIGDASGTAEGVPLTVVLSLVNTSASCAPLAGAAVYLWHCDREGRYSMYSDGADDENYLRGVQEADAAGQVRFTSIFPGCYDGRWPHIHFEVFASLDEAVGGGRSIATSQIALPESASSGVYGTDGYNRSVSNLARLSLDTDGVFRDDGAVNQLGTVTGNATDGFTVTLTVGVRA